MNVSNSIHKALKIGTDYKVRKSLSGYDMRKGFIGAKWYEMRFLHSTINGKNSIWAIREIGQDWKEVSSNEWYEFAAILINS